MTKKPHFNLPRSEERLKKPKWQWFLLILFVISLCAPAAAQTGTEKITLDLKAVSMETFVNEIKAQAGYTFFYNDSIAKAVEPVTIAVRDAALESVLKQVLEPKGYTFIIEDKTVIIKKAATKIHQINLIEISGRVVDEQKNPIPGATVLVKGTTRGTATDTHGKFVLNLVNTDDITLLFSFVGMESREVKYTGQDSINVVLKSAVNEMDQVNVVSTGYQNVNRRDMVGSYTTLKADDIKIASYNNITDMLQGQVPGMVVTRTSSRAGSSPSIKIRGTSTLGNTDPLFVVDGIIQDDPIEFNAQVGTIDDMENIIGNQISWLNPSDIETITILKDASATAVYGSRASNGVIVITTKRPKSGDRISVNYTGNVSISPRPRYSQFNLMNSKERVAFSEEAFGAGAKYATTPLADYNTYEGVMRMFFDGTIEESEYRERKAYLETLNTDWLDLLTRTTVSHNHNLSIGGASDKATYLFSVGYNKENGQEKGNSTERFTSRVSVNMRPHEKIRLAFNINGTVAKTKGFANGVDPLGYATSTSRAIPAFEEDGSYAYYQRVNTYQYNGENASLSYNILNEMDNSGSTIKNGRVNFAVDFTWELTDWLSYQLTGGYTYNSTNTERFSNERTYYIASNYRGYDYGTVEASNPWYAAAQLPHGGELFSSSATQHSYNVQNKLLIQKTFNEIHRLNVMLGTEARSSIEQNTQNTFWGYAPERGYQFIDPALPENIQPVGSSQTVSGFSILNELYNGKASIAKQKNNFFSLFATAAYSLMDRYVFNFSIRNDASNRFGQDANRRVDPTYSFGLSWRVSEEDWMSSVANVISDLNLKVTYGIQGNVNLNQSPDLILHMYGVKQLYNTYYSTIASIPNPDLSWERTHTWDIGLDLQFFRSVNLVLDYYTRRSNAVISHEIPYENGMETMSINGGKLYNKGFEATLSFNPVNTKNFGINLSVNASKNWNEGGETPFEATYTNFLNGISTSILKKGYPVNSFWSYDFAGLDPSNGAPIFNNMDVDNATALADPTTVLTYSGSKEPEFTGGLNLGVRYKSLTLRTSFSLLLGGHQRLPNPYRDFSYGVRIPEAYVNLTKELHKRWKEPGDENRTDIPALLANNYTMATPFSPTGGVNMITHLYQNSDALVVSSSFLRCRNLSLSWRMNPEWTKKFGLQSFLASFSMSNLFVVASDRFNGFDPELEESVMPKSYSISLSIGF